MLYVPVVAVGLVHRLVGASGIQDDRLKLAVLGGPRGADAPSVRAVTMLDVHVVQEVDDERLWHAMIVVRSLRPSLGRRPRAVRGHAYLPCVLLSAHMDAMHVFVTQVVNA